MLNIARPSEFRKRKNKAYKSNSCGKIQAKFSLNAISSVVESVLNMS